MKKENLVNEMNNNVNDCKFKLDSLNSDMHKARKNNDNDLKELLLNEMAVVSAKKQCFIQFLFDLENLDK